MDGEHCFILKELGSPLSYGTLKLKVPYAIMYLPKLSSGGNILSRVGYTPWVSLPSSHLEALGTVCRRSQVYSRPEHPQSPPLAIREQ